MLAIDAMLAAPLTHALGYNEVTMNLSPTTFVLAALWLLSQALEADDQVQFNRDIRPILSDNCFACHGPDARHRQADLRLDLREAAVEAKAIVPGQATSSQIIVRVRSTDADAIMPPPSSHKKLTAAQIELLENWIDQGAEYQKHWSYEQPVKAEVPAGRHPIDVLVERQLADKSLKLSPLADRRTLIRRLAFDLTGLPPDPIEVESFLNDTSATAYEQLVDRLLDDPHYGERMAIGWLDVVRFADTIGYHSDNPRNVWPYRDWVIESFNKNKRFDRFTLEQIAGDLLPDADQETRVGSAFNRLLLSTEEGGAQPRDYEARMLTDRVRAIGAAWLGQTTGCAQCHDHKFDPFTTRDFYALGAFFADIKEPIVGRREEGMVVCPPDQWARWQELKTQARNSKESAKELESFEASLPHCLVSSSLPEPRKVRVLPRGNWMDESGEVVQPAFPSYLKGPDASSSSRELTRLDLAQWLVARDNPLTARTVMNRLWKQFFGMGLSRVLDDLGAQGEPPTNAPLLDYLACEFMDSGWDMKHMVRLIVTSHTYRQVSTASPELRTADPLNRWLARQSPFRLEAELVRDNALKVSGLLVNKIGGPSVKPYQPEGYWENLNFPTREYAASPDQEQYRRGLYVWWQRSFLHPSLLAFDAPSREECTADRNRSNLPQQALVLLNDPTYVEAARALAGRILAECPGDDAPRMAWAWQQVLQRTPTASEQQAMMKLLEKQRQAYSQNRAAAEKFLKIGLAPASKDLDACDLAAWTHVARVLLNLHETITRS